MSRLIVPGDIGLYMIVWPTARTITAPAICYRQPRCVVRAIAWPYAVITPQPRRGARDGGPRYRVHVDNLQRTDPAHRRRPTRPVRIVPVPSGLQLRLF